MREQPGAADIGKEAKTDFRHRKLGPLGHHAMRTMRRQTDAAAHHNAIHERDIRLWKAGDAGVEDVLLAPENLAEIAVGARTVVERTDVAAGTEAAVTGSFQEDQNDIGIRLELIERLLDAAKHFERDRIDRLRPVEADDTGASLPPNDQVLTGIRSHLSRHHPPHWFLPSPLAGEGDVERKRDVG